MDVDLLEDQKYILDKIIGIAKKEKIDALLLSGDIYDVSIPRIEAISLLNDFLTKMNGENIKVFIISGNHDQAERLSFGNKILNKEGIYISEQYKKNSGCISLNDEFGKINFFLLPYIKPINIRNEFQIEENISYNEAVKRAIENFSINKNERNILLAHQFITGGVICESESIQVGNTDQVDVKFFSDFDYVALGHLHMPQILGKNNNIRYSGSPLKLSFSETKKEKICYLIDIKQKYNLNIKEIPIQPLHDMAIIKGDYKELVDNNDLKTKHIESYLKIELTDKTDIPYVKDKLKTVYHNALEVIYERQSKKLKELNSQISSIKDLSEFDLVQKFFKEQMNKELNKKQEKYITEALEKLEK